MNKNIYIESIILAAVSGTLILLIRYIGKYEQVERFLYENDKNKYYVMKACYLILLIALSINIKCAFSQMIKDIATAK